MLLPYCSLAISDGSIEVYGQIMSVLNIGLLVTSVISIKQYFFPGDDNRMPFHVFNLIFGVLFYCISLPYLIVNKQYYEGYQDLIPLDIIGKFFFSFTLSAARQWVILLSFFINVLYVKKYNKDYYESGMGLTVDSEKESKKHTVEVETIEHIESTVITANDEQTSATSSEQTSEIVVEDITTTSTTNEEDKESR
jgi:hypothetical protein